MISTSNINELLKEYDVLCIESIGFQRAAIDNVDFDRERDNYVYNRIIEIEKLLFPLLTNRVEVLFNQTSRQKMWRKCDEYEHNGYIIIKNLTDCDQFACNTVTGKIIFAKRP